MNPRKLILRCGLSPGDIVMLTAAVRDLHRARPGEFLTDVRTCCAGLWEHNTFITPIADSDPEAEVIECDYPLINHANARPYHCLHGFMRMLSERLGVVIEPTEFRGHVPIADIEKTWMSQVHELTGEDTPFWIIVAGGKFDVPIKWWAAERFQRVVDHFRGLIQFVQVGEEGHYHPPLKGVIDLRGRTNLRQFIRLVYHSQGILCPVTAAMHLAAAVETKPGMPPNRPCVVVAGGREPVTWEQYPFHQFLHTVGAMGCCLTGGCWKARVYPLGDGDSRDENLCTDVVGDLPRCMATIRADDVINRIELYFNGHAVGYLTPAQALAASSAVAKTERDNQDRLSVFTARAAAERFLRHLGTETTDFRIRNQEPGGEGRGASHATAMENPVPASARRGIVIPAGGPKYLPCAWVCINILRQQKCRLPIQLWHLGPGEIDSTFRSLVAPLGVQCIDAHEVRRRQPARTLKGWELKPYSIIHSGFEEVLLLDADNVPLVDPEFLFDTPEFAETGAIFWPDYGRLAENRSIWKLCGVPYRDEPEFETGQVAVDVMRCDRALRLTMWYNENSDFFYRHIHGDKDTFHLAFRKTSTPYSMPSTPIHPLDGVMCQHDFHGRRIFQHRNMHKWQLNGSNPRLPGFVLEEACLAALADLRTRWSMETATVDRVG